RSLTATKSPRSTSPAPSGPGGGSCRSRSQAAAGRPIPFPASRLGTVTRTLTATAPVPVEGRSMGSTGSRPGSRFITATSGGSPGRRQTGDDPAFLAPFPQHHATGAGRGAGPDPHLVAHAGVGGQRVPGRRVRVDQAGAGRGVIGVKREDGVAEFQAEYDPAVPGRHVGAAVPVDPVGRAVQGRVLDGAEHADR